jgi:hypothetical protein
MAIKADIEKDARQKGREKTNKEVMEQGELLPQARLLVAESVATYLTENCWRIAGCLYTVYLFTLPCANAHNRVRMSDLSVHV